MEHPMIGSEYEMDSDLIESVVPIGGTDGTLQVDVYASEESSAALQEWDEASFVEDVEDGKLALA
jgi:hypothetical protein